MIVLGPALLADVERRARDAYPEECCGLLVGRVRAADDAVVVNGLRASANVAACPRRRFEVDPRVRFAAERALRGGPDRVVGHYHSHPDGAPAPSAADRERAFEPGLVWLITPAGPGRAGPSRAYLFDAGAGAFREIAIERAAEAASEGAGLDDAEEGL